MKKTINVICGLFLLLLACGPKAQFDQARRLEKKGDYERAWEAYQEFAADHPTHSMAPEAVFRAGWVVQQGLADCDGARVFYQKVIAKYPQSEPWAEAASIESVNCPDYFPLTPGSRWEEGDSETKGQFARTVIECQPLPEVGKVLPSQAAVLERTYYGGTKKSFSTRYIYKKDVKGLREYASKDDSRSKTILEWPLEVGLKWATAAGGAFFHYEVLSKTEKVKVAAGEFEGCLKIKLSIEGTQGAEYEYYAPGVGRVLTTLKTQDGEKRKLELLSHKIMELPEFSNAAEKRPS